MRRVRTTVYWTEWGCGFSREFRSRREALEFARKLRLDWRFIRIM